MNRIILQSYIFAAIGSGVCGAQHGYQSYEKIKPPHINKFVYTLTWSALSAGFILFLPVEVPAYYILYKKKLEPIDPNTYSLFPYNP